MDIQILGAHNCESYNSRLVCLLIDDVLAIDAGCLSSSLSFSAQEKLKALLITHQHYDHIRDIPTVAMNFYLRDAAINIYSIPAVYDILSTHLFDGKLYPKFLEKPQKSPAVKFTLVEPDKLMQIEGYSVLAVPVSHFIPAVGYQITSPDGKSVFYTADTGPNLADCWQHISPHLLIAEVTAPNRYEDFAKDSGHLTPGLLKQELVCFRELKGYLPQVVVVHMDPRLEKEIEAEIVAVAATLNSAINLAYEGMQIHL